MSRPYKEHTVESLKARCDEIGQCWIWKGATDGKGRPMMRYHGVHISPRRLIRQLQNGSPVGHWLQVTSSCGDIACISPDCSVVSTPKTTAKLAVARGSYRNAERDRRMAMAKRAKSALSEEAVRQVRRADSARQAAAEAGISLSHAKAIRRGASRRDYGSPFAGLGARAANDDHRSAA